MELFFYKYRGKRVEPKDDDIHYPSLIPGESDDVAVCKSSSKDEAIIKFQKYFGDVNETNVFSISELYFIPGEDVCLLTTY